jgi:PAS domain S-box-containing protein
VSLRSQPPSQQDADRDRTRLAMEASGLGTWSWNALTGEVQWDEALERIYGLAPGSFPGTYDAYLELLHPLDRERVRSTVRESLENQGEHHVEHRVVWPDLSVHWVEGWGRVIFDEQGNPTGLFGVSADVTSRRRNEVRLARLQSVTEALANARTTEEVGRVAVHELLNAADALGSTLALLDGDGTTLSVAATSLPDAELPEHWRTFDVDSSLTAAEAVRTGAVVIRPFAEAEGPSAAVARMHAEVDEYAVVVALPIRIGGRTLGAIGLALPSAAGSDDESLEFLRTLVNQFGLALERAALYEAERAAGERVRLLAEATRTLGVSLDYQQTVAQVVNSAVPGFADWCTVELLNDHGELELLSVAHVDPDKVRLAWELREKYPSDPDAASGPPNVVRTGHSELLHSIPQHLIDQAVDRFPELAELIEQLHLTSAMTVPLSAAGRPLGVMNFVWGESERHYDEADLQIAEELARRAAAAIDNARLFDERSRIAATLQSSLRPPKLPEILGIEIASRYRPGGIHGEVAGDFYDVFPLREGSWLAVVGDVCGKGVEAAAVMALARYTIRTAALGRVRPSGILATLNEALLRSEMDRFCTACAVRIDQGKEAINLTIASAGHPRPIVVTAKGARFVDVAGTLLGVFPDPELHDETVELRPGEALLLYTDGVIEERSGGDMFGDARLIEAAEGGTGGASELVNRVMRAVQDFSQDPPTDDIALLAVRNGGPRPEGGV